MNKIPVDAGVYWTTISERVGKGTRFKMNSAVKSNQTLKSFNQYFDYESKLLKIGFKRDSSSSSRKLVSQDLVDFDK